ncbi:hypothetical protein [Pseudonocardia sp. TRM90224]|uniref:hypothetical protein n=1 Tax=Pseudonocardia sp. TRM90224 TaxID=2812678 RepID=UPI001E2B19FD|nr:hypothetical protein [Pseudonocardia sp. TRM90224]
MDGASDGAGPPEVGKAVDLPPFGPGEYHEMRVHGVAGSSAESMLGLQARLGAVDVVRPATGCGEQPQPGDISVWHAPTTDPVLRAWSWGSLTSGHWYQAFYVLLLPFMIANLAGWMLLTRQIATPAASYAKPNVGAGNGDDTDPGYRDRSLRHSMLLVRLVGLLVTVVFVVSVQLAVADLLVWQWLHHKLGWPVWTVGLGPVGTAAVFAGVVVLTRIRLRPQLSRDPWTDQRDPVGFGFLQRRQTLLWNSPGINVTLRRLHLAGGLATIGVLAAWPSGTVEGIWSAARWLAFGLACGAGVLVVGLLAAISLGDGRRGMAAVMGLTRHVVWMIAAFGVAFAAVAPIGLSPETDTMWTTLPALRGAAAWVAAGTLAGTVALLVLGLLVRRDRRDRRAANAPSVLLLAASIGAAFGAGLAGQTTRLVDGDCVEGPDCLVVGSHVSWLAIGVTTSLAVVIGVTAVRVVALLAKRGLGRWRTVPPTLTSSATWITALLGGTGFVLAGIGVGITLALPGGLPSATEFPVAIAWVVVALIVGPVVVGAFVLAWTMPAAARRRAGTPAGRMWVYRVLGLLAVAGAVALVTVAARNGWHIDVLDVPLPPRTFDDFAMDVAILLPTAALLTRIYGGLRNQGVRRGVGVLWDVGTFWPRWFHPLAPPTYADRAVPQLAAQLDADLAVAGHRLLLAPHSQGAVIAGAALLDGASRPGLAMLSYGSPWNRLYAEFFPAHVNAETTAALADRLRTGDRIRWRNLHRETDPIGGAIPGVDDQPAMPDPCRRGHSDYWVEPAYRAAAEELREVLDAPTRVPAPGP